MIASPTSSQIEKAARLLLDGKVLAFPTETVYGLGADACNESAVQHIFEVKGRPPSNPLIVHLADIEQLPSIADLSQLSEERKEQLKALQVFWPGPLSIILPKQSHIPDIVTAGFPTVAIRIPSHPVARALLAAAQIPVAAPSANPYMYVSPTSAQHVADQIGDKIPMILDGGCSQVGLESTVISLASDDLTLLRHGSITREMLEAVVGPLTTIQQSLEASTAAPSPGQHKKHYAPHTPVYRIDQAEAYRSLDAVGFIGIEKHRQEHEQFHFSKVSYLSDSNDLEEAARHLFSVMRDYDQAALDAIVIGSCSEDGIGAALSDRVSRALSEA